MSADPIAMIADLIDGKGGKRYGLSSVNQRAHALQAALLAERSGCNSALECLPQALPIVTFEGPTMRGRHSAAILRMIDVTDTIAATVDDYVAIATRLGQDTQFRQTMSSRMAENRHRLYGDRAPVTALENFLESAVRG